MKFLLTMLASACVLALGACTTVNNAAPANRIATPSSRSNESPGSARPTPTVTKTITKPHAPAGSRTATPSAAPPSAVPNVTDPWAVVSAYYGDIESGNYQEAWALLSSGSVTGQTYQQFVAGFACSGSQRLTKVSESGDTVSIDLAATDDCSGAVQHFSGTYTVQNGKIVSADVARSS